MLSLVRVWMSWERTLLSWLNRSSKHLISSTVNTKLSPSSSPSCACRTTSLRRLLAHKCSLHLFICLLTIISLSQLTRSWFSTVRGSFLFSPVHHILLPYEKRAFHVQRMRYLFHASKTSWRDVQCRHNEDILQDERLVLGVVRGQSSAFIYTKDAMFKDKEVRQSDRQDVRSGSDL